MPLKLFKRFKKDGSFVWHYRGDVAGDYLRGTTGTADKKDAARIMSTRQHEHLNRHLDGPQDSLTFPQAVALYLKAGKSDKYLDKIEDHWKDAKVKTMTPGAIRQSATGAKPLSPTHLVGIDPDAPGVVYFAYCGGRIKIGYSTDVANRMATLATSSPMPVTLLLTIRGSEEDEHLYHEMFADDRAHLEWFRLSLDLRDFLSSKFEHGTHELMTNAEFECRDELAEEALSLS